MSTSSTASSSMDPFAVLYQDEPEIWHTFRPADKRPNSFLALIFTGLSILPLLALLFTTVLPTLRHLQFPSSPREFLAASVFQGSIVAIVGALALYWLRLNIFQALTLIAVIAIVAVFSGTEALRLLHTRHSAATAVRTKAE